MMTTMGITKRVVPMVAIALAVLLAALIPVPAAAATVVYYHNDLAGSPIAATNESGQVIWRESYRPYGERLTNDPGSATNKIWFTSRSQDAATGLVYMGARWYDPVVGRFVSTDPKRFDEQNLHSFNRYAYANNNPLKFVDPDGRSPQALRVIAQGSFALANRLGARELGAMIGGSLWVMLNEGADSQGSGKKSESPKTPDPTSGSEVDPADTSGELTIAGRAQQKHGDRSGSAFYPAKGSPADKNEQGQDTIGVIVGSPTRVDENNRRGGTDVRESPGGRGARFDREGKFTGFIEPNGKQ